MHEYAVSQEIQGVFKALLSDSEVAKAVQFIEDDLEQAIKDQKELVQIESPTFHEGKRAQHYAEMLKRVGLENVHIDAHGNVLGYYRGSNEDGPTVLLEAHLDTVFSFGTDVTPIERDGKIFAPGICDDTRGLAANLSVARALVNFKPEIRGNITAVQDKLKMEMAPSICKPSQPCFRQIWKQVPFLNLENLIGCPNS